MWRATTPATSSTLKAPQANEQQPQRANTNESTQVSGETQSANGQGSRRTTAYRYQPYQQTVTLNARQATINDMVINSSCEPISRESNISWAQMPIRVPNQQLVQLHQQQLQSIQQRALFPASITSNNQNGMSSVCRRLMQNPSNTSTNHMCQHNNLHDQQQQLAHAGSILPCLCGLYMPLDCGQGQRQQCVGLSSGSTARPNQAPNSIKDATINNIASLQSYSNFMNNKTASGNNISNLIRNNNNQQQQQHSNLPATK